MNGQLEFESKWGESVKAHTEENFKFDKIFHLDLLTNFSGRFCEFL